MRVMSRLVVAWFRCHVLRYHRWGYGPVPCPDPPVLGGVTSSCTVLHLGNRCRDCGKESE